MISTSSNKIDEIVAPDEIETYVSMEETISPTTVFMRECFLSLMSAKILRTDTFPAI